MKQEQNRNEKYEKTDQMNADARRIESRLRPLRLIGWGPCLALAILQRLTGHGLLSILVICSLPWGAYVTYESTQAWESLRSERTLAYIADRSKFLAFTLRPKLLLHIAGLVGVVIAWFAILRFSIEVLVPSLGFIFYGNMFRWVLYLVICMLAGYYGGILARAVRCWYLEDNGYSDGSEYEPGETYKRAIEEQESKERAEAERMAAEAEEARKRTEEQEARQREAVEAYERNKEQARASIWEWLNIGLKLDFPDEVCEAISDFNLGRQRNIPRRTLEELLSKIVSERDAKLYTSKFRDALLAVNQARQAEELREGMEAQKNPLGTEGEANVNYRLKWWLGEHPGYKMVAADCFSEYSASCIRIAAWDYMKEPQEIDHMLIGPAGVIHIETKDYIGSITVRNTQFWERDVKMDGRITPFDSPAFQVQRHDAVVRHIVGDNIPVHSIICLSNKNVMLKDAEKSDVPIVCLRDLGEYLDALHNGEAAKLSQEEVDRVFLLIEKAKVRNSRKKAAYEQKRAESK